MRRAAKVDANQAEIVRALRAIGAKVIDISAMGGGCPDLIVGHRNRTILLEVKRPKGARITKQQEEFFATWPGEAYIVQTISQALEAILGKKAMT